MEMGGGFTELRSMSYFRIFARRLGVAKLRLVTQNPTLAALGMKPVQVLRSARVVYEILIIRRF
jgi:hypothetical protein